MWPRLIATSSLSPSYLTTPTPELLPPCHFSLLHRCRLRQLQSAAVIVATGSTGPASASLAAVACLSVHHCRRLLRHQLRGQLAVTGVQWRISFCLWTTAAGSQTAGRTLQRSKRRTRVRTLSAARAEFLFPGLHCRLYEPSAFNCRICDFLPSSCIFHK